MTSASNSRPPVTISRGDAAQASIPLAPERDVDRTASLGTLVKDATTQVSTLVRAEIELAKAELSDTVKNALRGSVFFIAAGAIALFSLWFFWLMIGEVIAIWLPRWAAFVIVFFAMLVIAGFLALLGIRRVKKIRKPEKTISSLSQTASTLKAAASFDGSPAGTPAGQ